MIRYAAYFGLGLLLGAGYLALLWVAVRLLVSHPRGRTLYALLSAVRLVAVGAAFFAVLRLGAAAGLVALAGLVAARMVATRMLRARPAPGPP